MGHKLEVSFNSPQCGWMSIGFDDGAHEFHTTTAHAPHEKALGELLRILSEMLGDDPQTERVLKWNRNPEEFDFRFVKNGGELVLEIYQYPTESRETRERVFAHAGNVSDICGAFAETFEQLYRDRETDDFEFNWRQPFPLEEYARFRSKLDSKRL